MCNVILRVYLIMNFNLLNLIYIYVVVMIDYNLIDVYDDQQIQLRNHSFIHFRTVLSH